MKFSEYNNQLGDFYITRKYNGFAVKYNGFYIYTDKKTIALSDNIRQDINRFLYPDLKQVEAIRKQTKVYFCELWVDDTLESPASLLAGTYKPFKLIPYGFEDMTIECFYTKFTGGVNSEYVHIPDVSKVTLKTPFICDRTDIEGYILARPSFKMSLSDWSSNVLSHDIFKLKNMFDHDAEVLGYTGGKTGKNIGRVGALNLKLTWGERVKQIFGGKESFVGKTVYFDTGSGLTDDIREYSEIYKKYPVGTKLVIHFNGVTHLGTPIHSRIGEIIPNV